MQRYGTCFVAAALAVFVGVLPGCGMGGGDQLTVRGRVTLDDKPLESGIITFLPVDGKGPSGGDKITNGQYETQLTPGEKKVSILAQRVKGTQLRDPKDPNSEKIEIMEQYLPACYNTASTLKVTISPTNKTADFSLKSK